MFNFTVPEFCKCSILFNIKCVLFSTMTINPPGKIYVYFKWPEKVLWHRYRMIAVAEERTRVLIYYSFTNLESNFEERVLQRGLAKISNHNWLRLVSAYCDLEFVRIYKLYACAPSSMHVGMMSKSRFKTSQNAAF